MQNDRQVGDGRYRSQQSHEFCQSWRWMGQWLRLVADVLLKRQDIHYYSPIWILTYFWRSYETGIPGQLPTSLIPQIKTFISTSDISLLSQALSPLSLLLELAAASTFPEVEHDLLKDIYSITHSPLISGVALESLFKFYTSLRQPVRYTRCPKSRNFCR